MQTFSCFHKLMICVSHYSTISLMDNIADGHDEEVMEWQDTLSQELQHIQPPTQEDVNIIQCPTVVYVLNVVAH